MNFSQFAAYGAVIALIAGTWRQAWAIIQRIADFAVCRVVVKDEAALALQSYVWRHGKRSPFGMRVFGGTKTYVHPPRRVELVAYEGITSVKSLVWFNKRPAVFGLMSRESGAPDVGESHNNQPVSIYYIRGTLDIDGLMVQAVEEYNAMHHVPVVGAPRRQRFSVQRCAGTRRNYDNSTPVETSGHGSGQLVAPAQSDSLQRSIQTQTLRLLKWKQDDLIERSDFASPFTGYAFPPSIIAHLDEIKTWLDNEQWFRSKCVPWRRGWLLYGPPGTGKSTLIRAIGLQFDLPIYVFDLASMTNEDMAESWSRVKQNAPAIALLEDIDGVFEGRENIVTRGKQRDGLTFDCLLNTISGVGNNDGVLLMVTTNRVETLDPALGVPDGATGKSSRPGRIDRAIYLGAMAEQERRTLAAHILSDELPGFRELVVQDGKDETAAQFQDRCAQIALRRFWERKGEMTP